MPSSTVPAFPFAMARSKSYSTSLGRRFVRVSSTVTSIFYPGEKLQQLEKEKGIVIRFMIGHSATSNSILDRAIDSEEAQHNDFLRLEHVEGYLELSAKTKIFFSTAVAKWDAELYVTIDEDVLVNLGMLAATLARHRSKPRIYIGCMKSGPVLSSKNVKYHEPEYWKFGEERSKYFRHATGQYCISMLMKMYH